MMRACYVVGLMFHVAATPFYVPYFVLSVVGDWFVDRGRWSE